MIPGGKYPSREAVLDAFAVESELSRSTLERYLRLYPEYAGELIDLSRELSREAYENAAPLSVADQALIDAAWLQHANAGEAVVINPFSELTANDLRAVAQYLDIPRQVVTALREQQVTLASIPQGFRRSLAEAVHCTVVQLEAFWGGVPLADVRSYKADSKPAIGKQVSFERVLIDAGVPDEKRARLLAEKD